jgi:hypothetical protein
MFHSHPRTRLFSTTGIKSAISFVRILSEAGAVVNKLCTIGGLLGICIKRQHGARLLDRPRLADRFGRSAKLRGGLLPASWSGDYVRNIHLQA